MRLSIVCGMDISRYLAFLSAAFVIIIIPGPTNLVILSDSLRSGFRKAVWTVAGAALAHALFLTAFTAGFATLVETYPRAIEYIRVFGVVYLAWTGLKLIVSSPSSAAEAHERAGAGNPAGYLLRGFLVNATNPKALLFYAAFFPPFIATSAPVGPQLVVLGLTFLAIFVAVGLLHAFVPEVIHRRSTSRRARRRVNVVAGSAAIGAGIWLATR